MKDIDKIFEDWDELEYEFDREPMPIYEKMKHYHYQEFIGRKVIINPECIYYKELKREGKYNLDDIGKISSISITDYIEVIFPMSPRFFKPGELLLVNE